MVQIDAPQPAAYTNVPHFHTFAAPEKVTAKPITPEYLSPCIPTPTHPESENLRY
ncbi:MAG: hypothetical protein LBI53_02120 [Candidatus Peribacteria bacterium]|nr:hypothetical protein [Candidatus Peribacteria bacterium]